MSCPRVWFSYIALCQPFQTRFIDIRHIPIVPISIDRGVLICNEELFSLSFLLIIHFMVADLVCYFLEIDTSYIQTL